MVLQEALECILQGFDVSGDKITSVVKNRSGEPIGTMVFGEDGSFSGRLFGTTSFVEVFGEFVKIGLASGIILYPELIPAVPKPPPCSSGRDRDHFGGSSIALVEIPTLPAVHLCKVCLNELLDWADDQPSWEPKEIKFLDRVA